MKSVLLGFVFLMGTITLVNGQNAPQPLRTPPVDASGMDMTYFPSGYAQLKAQGRDAGKLTMRLIYSRPQKKGREMVGQTLPYGTWWRLGANEATELTVFEPVTIGGKLIEKGRYTLSCIPNEKTWTIILNSETDIWGEGPSKYNAAKDVVRVEVPVEKLPEEVENFSMGFLKTPTGAGLLIAWEKNKLIMPITF